MSGLQVAARIAQQFPQTRILMFTMHESPRLTIETKQAGAHGVVLKSQATRDLVRAIDRLISGDTFFDTIEEKEEPLPISDRRKQHYERCGLWGWIAPSPALARGAELEPRRPSLVPRFA